MKKDFCPTDEGLLMLNSENGLVLQDFAWTTAVLFNLNDENYWSCRAHSHVELSVRYMSGRLT